MPNKVGEAREHFGIRRALSICSNARRNSGPGRACRRSIVMDPQHAASDRIARLEYAVARNDDAITHRDEAIL